MKKIATIIFSCLLLISCGENQNNSSDHIEEVQSDKMATNEDLIKLLDKYDFEYTKSSNPQEITETVGQLEERIKEFARMRDEFKKNNPDANKPLTKDQIEFIEFYKRAAAIKDPIERSKMILDNKEFLLERGENAELFENIERDFELRGIKYNPIKNNKR